MSHFLFSLNATIPIFLVILLGYLLRRSGMFTEEFVRIADRFSFKITLPILLFVDIATADISSSFDWSFVLYCFLTTVAASLVIWGASHVLLPDKHMIGTFTMVCFRGSAAVLSVAFVTNLYGNAGFAPLMIVAVVPFYNFFSVIILSLSEKNETDKPLKLGQILFRVITNPLILAVFAALPFACFHITIPAIPLKVLNSIGSIASPFALLVLGAAFDGKQALTKWKPVAVTTFIKLAVLPGIFIPLAVQFGFRDAKLVAISIMFASPTTVACYIMAKNMKNDADLAAGTVMFSTLLSSVTITIIIFLLRSNGLI